MTNKILSIILLISTGFIACKKESITQPKTTQEKMLGKWNLVSTVTNDFYNGSPHLTTYTWLPSDYIDFRANGKAYGYNNGSYDTTTYGIIDDSKMWIEDAAYMYDIQTLSETDLKLYRKEIFSSTEYTEATATAKR